MDLNKDYYSILGVLPTAELVVIKAAYKAMLKVYHPDRFNGTQAEAHTKSIEINEAHFILSDIGKRKIYDASKKEKSFYDESNGHTGQNSSASSASDKEWQLACKYNHELIHLEKELYVVSPKLSFAFRATLIGSKNFSNAEQISKELLVGYLDTYFGPNQEVMGYANKLLIDGYRAAAKELNQVVKIFGKDINAKSVINQIEVEFCLYSYSDEARAKAQKQECHTKKKNKEEDDFNAWMDEFDRSYRKKSSKMF
jgi:curved DNA-binding protein CbpA